MANTAINHDPAATFPGSSTDTAVVKWSGTGGKTLVNSGVLVDASNNITGLNNVTATGYLHLTGDEKELRFYEGANYIAIKTNASLAANYTLTLPLNDGAADEFLQTNGSGVLTWAAAAGTTINSNADNRVITGSGTANTLNGETGLVFTGTLLGINTATPDSGQYLHITGASGSVSGLTATTTSQMTVENNSNAAISILSPAADFGAVYFGDTGSNIAGGLIYNHGATRFDFRVEGSTKFLMETDDFTINDGNLVIGTAGHGIDFSANTQSAVSGAAMVSEVLDWYEEGTWTPIAKDHDGGTMSQQSNGDEGKYTRIGNTVYIQGRVICNGNGSATTSKTLTIHGLPFTHQNATNLQAHPHVGFAAATANSSATVSYGSLIEPGNNFINIMSWDATSGQTNTVVSEFSHDGQLGITGHYFVS